MINFCKNLFQGLESFANCFQSLLLLAMRLYWGGSLAISGWGKLHHLCGVADYFASLNIPFPLMNAYLVGMIECLGGLCLFLGFASRLAAIPILCVMIGALVTIEHRAALFNVLHDPQNLIVQTPFNYLLTACIVFAFGPGKISIDFLLEKRFGSISKL